MSPQDDASPISASPPPSTAASELPSSGALASGFVALVASVEASKFPRVASKSEPPHAALNEATARTARSALSFVF
jgi:hypothetical protein